jgi:hypothetical protein
MLQLLHPVPFSDDHEIRYAHCGEEEGRLDSCCERTTNYADLVSLPVCQGREVVLGDAGVKVTFVT